MSKDKEIEELYNQKIKQSRDDIEDIIKEEFDRIKKVFLDQNGEIIPKVDDELAKEIMCVFVGATVQYLSDKRESDILTNQEVKELVKSGKNSVDIGGNIGNMKNRKGFLKKVNQGEHKIIYHKLPEILDYILGED